jgi:hypothetical protein
LAGAELPDEPDSVPAPEFAPAPPVEEPEVEEGLDEEELDEEPALEPAAVEAVVVACFGCGSGVNGLRVAPPLWPFSPPVVSAIACVPSVLIGLSATAPVGFATAGEAAGGVDELDPPSSA